MSDKELENLKMAKKRDHKIMITEEAIKKVPYIRYREIPEEEYEIIHRLVQQVLKISKEENDSNEAAELKGYQDATKFFISNCYQAGIIYEDR